MRNPVVISKKLLKTFIKHQKLSGTVSFLRFLRKKKGLQDFYSFCEKNNCALPPFDTFKGAVLFHGSQQLRSILEPNTAMGREGKVKHKASVYATDDPNYAIFLAILHLRNGGAAVNATGNLPALLIDMDFINGPSKLKGGFVHIVPSTPFEKSTNREYKADRQVNTLFIVPVTPQDLTVPIYVQTSNHPYASTGTTPHRTASLYPSPLTPPRRGRDSTGHLFTTR